MHSAINRSILLVAVGHLLLELSNNYLPVIYPPLIAQMGLNFSQIGVIAFVATSAMALAQPLFGYLGDRIGPERVSALSIVWTGVIMGLVGLAWNYPSLLILIALGSLGSAAFHPPSAVIAAANSGANRGAGISIFSVGGNIGGALSPLWMALALSLFGLPGTLTLVPMGVICGLVLYWQLRRTHVATQERRASSRATAGTGFMAGLALVVVGMMFRAWYQVALTTYLPAWVLEMGGTPAAAARLLAIFLFAVSAGSLVGGPLGDRFGHWQVVASGTLLMSASHWVLMTSDHDVALAALTLSGIAVGATYPTAIVMAIEAWPRQVGVASGLLMGLGWWPGGFGAYVTGLIADHYSLTAALYTLVLPPLVGLLCVLAYAALWHSRQRAASFSQASKPAEPG
jgi:FSR family fosmidomycin resistance protein-like MFS transporter